MATVLVTGASGFAGTYIVEELLEHGYKWVFHRLRPACGPLRGVAGCISVRI